MNTCLNILEINPQNKILIEETTYNLAGMEVISTMKTENECLLPWSTCRLSRWP
jgi:hypothetical protein